jgi:O-antigen/teichoic acid export membrane protein
METLSSGFMIALPVGIILTLIGVAFSGVVANSWFSNIGISQFSLILVSPLSFFIVMQASANLALVGLKRSGLSSIASVTTDAIQLISIVLLIMLGYGVNGAIGGMLIGYAIGTVLSFLFLYKAVAKYGKVTLSWPKRESIKRAWDFSLPLAANNFLNAGMVNFGIIFLGLYVTATTLGNYGAAVKGLALLSLIYGTIQTVLLPTFSDVHLQTKKEHMHKTYNKLIIYAMIPVSALMIYLAVFSAPGLFVIVSGAYNTAPIYFTLISIGALINLFGTYVGTLLIARGYTRKLLVYNFYATLIELASLILLVVLLHTDLYKVIGAIIASYFIGNIAATIFFVNGTKKIMGVSFDYKRIAKLALTTITLGLILLLFYLGSTAIIPSITTSLLGNLVELVIGFAVMVIAFPILLAVFRVLGSEDITSVRRAIAQHGSLKAVMNIIFSYTTPFLR